MTYRTTFADFYSQYGRETDVYKHELYLYGRRPGAIYALDELQREDDRSATMISDFLYAIFCSEKKTFCNHFCGITPLAMLLPGNIS